MIKIDFDDTYEPQEIATSLDVATFYSDLKGGGNILLKIEVSALGDPLLPNVFNLAFGPMLANGDIDDTAQINHLNISKVFSTILLFGLSYLQANPEITIGVDGSNDTRAYLYHRMFRINKEYLDEYFVPIGVDWYVRLLRNGNVENDTHGLPFFKPKPEPFDYQRIPSDLYRYYMFHLRQNI